MDLREASHCNKELISRLRPRPAGAISSQAWDGALIYLGATELVVNHSNLSSIQKLAQLKELYLDLGVFELLRLQEVLQFPLKDLASFFFVPVKEENSAFFKNLVSLPRVLQDHLELRKVKISELGFLRAWDSQLTSEQEAALLKIVELNLSLQSSLKCFEILIDLCMMEKSLDTVAAATNEVEFTNALFQLRFPISHRIQEKKKTQMSEILWPAFAKAKVARRGDRTGFEVQAFICSETDLTKMMATLERVKEKFNSDAEPFQP